MSMRCLMAAMRIILRRDYATCCCRSFPQCWTAPPQFRLVPSERIADHSAVTGPPHNKRLKLAGGDRSKGSGVLCAGAHELSFNYTARNGRVARQLKRDPLGGHTRANEIDLELLG